MRQRSYKKQTRSRIAELEDKLARVEVIDISKLSGDTVKFGVTVTLMSEDVGKSKCGKLSASQKLMPGTAQSRSPRVAKCAIAGDERPARLGGEASKPKKHSHQYHPERPPNDAASRSSA
jgi:hypothetical protein